MNLNKSQWEKIASIVLGAALAVFAVAGWVVNPATLLEAPEARLREKISIDARDDAYLYNGADFYVYSDDHATQKMLIDGATGGLTSASTITVTAGGLVISSGSLNMSNGTILNVGNAGTDFDAAGGLTTAYAITVTTGGLNLSNGVASNIGAAGTDFDANGGLTTASTITITAGGLNASNGVISNVGNAGTDFDANGGLTTASTITVTAGGLKISNGNAQINDLIIVDTPAAQTVTDGGGITPTATYYQLTASGAVTATLETTGFTAGTLVTLVNTAAQDVLIQDTANQVLSADITLNQYDTLTLLFDGTRWLELARSNN